MLLQRVNCYPSVKKRLSVSLRTQAVGFGKPETSGSVLVRNDEQGTLGTPLDEVQLIKGKLHLEVYLQYENTDTSTSEEYDEFFRNGNYRGEVRRLDRYGNGRTYYFMYNPSDKASVMKSILLEYVFTKYAAKLTQQAA